MNNIKLGKYKHYKGKFYEVIGIAKHSETLEDLVVYKGIYDSRDFVNNPLWVRPLSMFNDKVEVNGELIFRFKYIG